MADWSDIGDLWWLQPRGQPRDSTRGLALGAQIAQNRTENQWRQEQAQTLIDQKRAQLRSQEAKIRGISAMSSYLADVASRNAWADPEAMAGAYKILADYPQVFDDQQGAGFLRNFESAQARVAQAQEHAQTPAIKELNEADRAGREAKAFEDFAIEIGAGKPGFDQATARARNLREREAILKGRQTPTGESIKMYDREGNLITDISRGGAAKAPAAPGDLTVATRTKLQENMMGYADVAETLAYINKHKDASDFGVAGQFKEMYARVAGQLGVPIPAGTVSTRAAVTTLRAALVKSLRSDSNIAEPERKELEKAIPSTKDITESFPTAVDKLNEAARNIFGRSSRAAEDLKQPKPAWVIPPDQLREEFRAGRYGDPKSQEAQQKFIQDLRRYHGFD